MTRLSSLVQTCSFCPSQWEAVDADTGEHIYIRYRWGLLTIGRGATIDDAVADYSHDGIEWGDDLDGTMTTSEMLRLLDLTTI